jgi:hypothetical protein
MLSLRSSFLQVLATTTLLTFFLTTNSLAGGPAMTTTGNGDQWYITKWTHDHDHAHDHAEHAEHAAHGAGGPRMWEPYRQIDPRTVSGYQEMYEVTQFPREEPATDAQRHQAEEFVRRCREAAARHGWSAFDQARRDGFQLLPEDPWHYVNTAYALDEKQLDPDRPEVLMFYDTPAGKRLAAFMFLARGIADHGRQIGGPLTLWHFHVWAQPKCFGEAWFVVGEPDSDGRCENGVLASRSPEMLHVWLIDHPSGPFSADMTLTDEMQKQLAQPVAH